jgi:hypothetical protein
MEMDQTGGGDVEDGGGEDVQDEQGGRRLHSFGPFPKWKWTKPAAEVSKMAAAKVSKMNKEAGCFTLLVHFLKGNGPKFGGSKYDSELNKNNARLKLLVVENKIVRS